MEIGGSVLLGQAQRSTKKGLSPCHKQSEVSECHLQVWGLENSEIEDKKALTVLRLEPIPAKNGRQGF